MALDAVFFDLDGTLLDTAPDLACALNAMLASKNRAPLHFEDVRRVVSDGAAAMIALAFNVSKEHEDMLPLRQELLDFYLQNLATHTRPFEGIEALIEQLAKHKIRWGIVTNKPWVYTEPLMKQIKFASEPVATICPEHVKERKPSPEALYLACKQAACNSENAIYIGDHLRDIQCGLNAGMPTIAVGYGYIPAGDHPDNWGATHSVTSAKELWPIIQAYLDISE
ncbi:phosphoglycolate phosphatase [Alteromonadaceae bacterium Bs31]|nr:phosphoglycolate phosphatase [Alteromonadaceae bacterium Bs31]